MRMSEVEIEVREKALETALRSFLNAPGTRTETILDRAREFSKFVLEDSSNDIVYPYEEHGIVYLAPDLYKLNETINYQGQEYIIPCGKPVTKDTFCILYEGHDDQPYLIYHLDAYAQTKPKENL